MKKKSSTESNLNQNSQNMFGVPDTYFKDLPDRILKSTETRISGEVRIIHSWERFRPALLVAASVLGFIIITYTGQKLFRAEKESNLISRLDAIEYIDFYSQEFGEELLLGNIDTDFYEDDMTINDTDEIIEYLIQEGIDDLTLYNEL